MGTSAFLIGELSWPMPDPGLIAVWRAMTIDASKWNDWGELDVGTHAGTVGALVDDMGGRLSIDDTGVNLRGRIEDAAAWQRLVIAWRAAADLGATGELVCCAEAPETGYKATIGEYSSRWAKLSAQDVAALGIAGARAKPAKRPTTNLPAKTPAKRPTAKIPPVQARSPAKAKAAATAKSAKKAAKKPAKKSARKKRR